MTGCGTKEVARPHLHNFPHLEDCPSLEERHIENEAELKAQAKALNMRYVDYLHFLTNSKVNPRNSPVPLESLDREFLEARAKSLNMRYEDFLHALTNDKINHLRNARSANSLGEKN